MNLTNVSNSLTWNPYVLLPVYRLETSANARGAGRNLQAEFGITPPAVTFYGSAYAQNIGAD